MIVYAIEPSQPSYLLDEAVYLTLTVENQGSETVEIPDPLHEDNHEPEFEIERLEPAAKAVGISNWSAMNGPQAPPPPLQRIPLSGGGKWQEQIQVNSCLPPLREAGEYQVGSSITVETAQVRAPKKTIQIVRPVPVSIAIGQGTRPINQGEGQLVFLQKGDTSTAVYSARAVETDPSNSEVVLRTLMRRATASANASDILSPSSNAPVYADLTRWILWREGAKLKSISTLASEPVELQLPQQPDSLVRPALTTKTGPALVLSIHGKALSLISVARKLEALPELRWTAELPAVPASITATISPVALGDKTYVAMLAAADSGFDLYCAPFTVTGLGAFEKIHVADGKYLSNTPVVAMVSNKGTVHVAALRSDASKDKEVRLSRVEALFGGEDNPEPKLSVQSLPALEKPVTRGALLFVASNEGVPLRREVVVESGEDLWNLTGGGAFQPILPRRTFPSPLTLMAGDELSYVLFQNAQGAVHFEPLNR